MVFILIIFSIIFVVLVWRLPTLNKYIAEKMDLKIFDRNFYKKLFNLLITNLFITGAFYYINNFDSKFDLIKFVNILCIVVIANLLLLSNFYYMCFVDRKKELKSTKKSILEFKITILITTLLVIAINMNMILNEKKIINVILIDIIFIIIISIYIIRKIISLKKIN